MSIRTSKSMSGLGGASYSTLILPSLPSSRSSTTSLSSMVASSSVGGGSSMVVSSNVVCSTFPTPRKSNRHAHHSQRPEETQQPPTRKKKTKNTIHREYQMLQSQTLLLVGTASLSFLLFLLFTLPFAALIGLTVMVTSLGACILVATSAIKTRYHLELEQHPLGLIRYLPEKIRCHLTEKSLHDCLSPSGSKESLCSLSQSNSKGSLVSMMNNSSSRGSLSSMTQQQQHHYLDQQNSRQRVKRGAR